MMLKTGCKTLDELLGGGIESEVLTELYGEAGSGKTNICLQIARNCVLGGKRVIYIDTEGVSLERLRQICGDRYKEVLKHIIFFQPYSLEEQHQMVEKAIHMAERDSNIGLIVLDSATIYYRYELGNGHDVDSIRSLSHQITQLLSVTRKHKIPVLVTNQVYTNISKDEIEPVGGQVLKHVSKAIIKLEKMPKGRRRASIIKHRSLPEQSAEFVLTSRGVESKEGLW